MTSVFNFTFVPWFRSVAPYIHKFRNQTFVVGMAGEALDVLNAVARRGPRAKAGAADIDGVRAMVDRLDADVSVTGGGEQLELVLG